MSLLKFCKFSTLFHISTILINSDILSVVFCCNCRLFLHLLDSRYNSTSFLTTRPIPYIYHTYNSFYLLVCIKMASILNSQSHDLKHGHTQSPSRVVLCNGLNGKNFVKPRKTCFITV